MNTDKILGPYMQHEYSNENHITYCRCNINNNIEMKFGHILSANGYVLIDDQDYWDRLMLIK